MRAILNDRYGPPEGLRLDEIDPPVIGDDGILVRVRASSVNALDWHAMRGKPYLVRAQEGLRRPSTRIPGVDIAGVVEAVGSAVTAVRPGDEVMAHRGGAWAELVACTERHVVPKPAGLSFEEVAAVPVAAMTALQGLRDKGGVTTGSRVLITGAGGGVGTFAVQIARALGGEVTATTRSDNVDLVRSLGAAHVIDYTREDVTEGAARFDVILDIAATSP
ncbi:MAG TPA: NAD(P)-dependent alcohol dehydrogenase, partial [Candidatus Limnocylindrales bacterium]|nr:NAD(P)-dependent alcohol dehydrogenase [Candidatus Limnocylindrales bacterium]